MNKSRTNKRKHVRKGTRSCIECRRRKVRCIFSAGSPVCIHCVTRGCECVDQRDGDNELSLSKQHDNSGPVALARGDTVPFPDVTTPMQDAKGNPPLISIMGEANAAGSNTAIRALESPSNPQSPRLGLRQSLLSALPGNHEVIATLNSNDYWWESFRKKTRAISQTDDIEPLGSFAARALADGSPAELATVVISYERSLDTDYRRLAVVEEHVMSSYNLLCTLQGLECLILLAKTYTDIGKPKRAWFTWRKGIAAVQFLGLYRLSPDAPSTHHRVWWAIYHGDRFTSLLLGLPHGFNDALLDGSQFKNNGDTGNIAAWIARFVHETSVVAGQVIDHNVVPKNRSFATAMKLNEQLDSIYNSAPPGWWDVERSLPKTPEEDEMHLDRLLIQFFFLHTRMYLHLPFLDAKTPATYLAVSSQLCIEAASQLLERYLALRKPFDDHGRTLFECKTTDFVGFTAAVVLAIARTWRMENDFTSSEEHASGLKLVMEVEAVLDGLRLSKNCPVAAECYRVLHQLLGPTKEETISIPYFGKVLIRETAECPAHVQSRPIEQDTSAQNFPTMGASVCNVQFTEYLAQSTFWQTQQFDENYGMSGDAFLGFSSMDWDINQDWSLGV